MRRGLAKTFRCNLLEFDTDAGLRYAAPTTFWARLYLIWTFRNFPRLPKQVFNRHQQRLINELIQSSTISVGMHIDRRSVIGTVEQVRLESAVVSQMAILPATSGKKGTAHIGSDRRWQTQSESATPTAQDKARCRSKADSTGGTRTSSANPQPSLLKFCGLAVIMGAVFLGCGIFLHRQGVHFDLSSTALTRSRPIQPTVHSVAMPGRPLTPQLWHGQDIMGSIRRRQAPVSVNTRSSEEAPSSSTSSHTEGQISLAAMTSPAQPRLHDSSASLDVDTSPLLSTLPRLSGPPQSRMTYPRYPETERNGKVVLTAVVAADGRVRTVNVISGSKIFASAARRAVREWRYLPYELHGTAIEFQTTIAFNFRGNEVISISFPQL